MSETHLMSLALHVNLIGTFRTLVTKFLKEVLFLCSVDLRCIEFPTFRSSILSENNFPTS